MVKCFNNWADVVLHLQRFVWLYNVIKELITIYHIAIRKLCLLNYPLIDLGRTTLICYHCGHVIHFVVYTK